VNVWLSADTIGYPEGGGHLWAYLNYALGLRSLGCDVTWLEERRAAETEAGIHGLRTRLEPYGLAQSIALWGRDGRVEGGTPEDADLLLSLRYTTSGEVVRRFRRTALVDIDPGLLQLWLRDGLIDVPQHDAFFTTGLGVGELDPSREWLPTCRCVALDWWPPEPAAPGAAYSTVTHWYADEWIDLGGGDFRNDKRSGFLPFLDLPLHVDVPLELAVQLGEDEGDERNVLIRTGWRVVPAREAAGSPEAYAAYIRSSRGELSCAKPSAVLLANGWISDRTACYLASGRPAIVQDTGPSNALPANEGLWRFRTPDEAAAALEAVEADHDRQARLARRLAEELFDAHTVLTKLLERAV
jgi:hypothetical protein